MLDFKNLAALTLSTGWTKAIFVAALVLLQQHVVSFEECLLLIASGVVVGKMNTSASDTKPTKEESKRADSG